MPHADFINTQHAVFDQVGLNEVHVTEALVNGLTFWQVIEQDEGGRVIVGYGYTSIHLPSSQLRLLRANGQDDSFIRVRFILTASETLYVLHARECTPWELEEYGNESERV